jgi:hypothetical protein
MQEEKEMTSQESLELISRMINKARKDYYDTGLSALLWGSVITICSLLSFVNYWLMWPYMGYCWFLTLAAIIPQVMISIRESRKRRHKGYEDDFMSGIWISFSIAIFLLSWVMSWLNLPYIGSIYMIVYGIPTFTTGYARRFKPMLIGGIACWVFALLSVVARDPYVFLYLAASAQLAWFIPGLILRKRYLKAKENHV